MLWFFCIATLDFSALNGRTLDCGNRIFHPFATQERPSEEESIRNLQFVIDDQAHRLEQIFGHAYHFDLSRNTRADKLPFVNYRIPEKSGTYRLVLNTIGHLIFTGQWADYHHLNFVYDFTNSSTPQITSLPQFLITHYPGEEVVLVRNMDAHEADLWKSSDTAGLDLDPRYWGNPTPVFHFELGRRSWIGSDRSHSREFRIPKKTFLQWIQTGNIQAGFTRLRGGTEIRSGIEIVIKRPLWPEIFMHAQEDSRERIPFHLRLCSRALSMLVRAKSRSQSPEWAGLIQAPLPPPISKPNSKL